MKYIMLSLTEFVRDTMRCTTVFINRICKRYDEMADKVSEIPETTKALVDTQEYLKQVSIC